MKGQSREKIILTLLADTLLDASPQLTRKPFNSRRHIFSSVSALAYVPRDPFETTIDLTFHQGKADTWFYLRLRPRWSSPTVISGRASGLQFGMVLRMRISFNHAIHGTQRHLILSPNLSESLSAGRLLSFGCRPLIAARSSSSPL
jgi:hypothetical protein